MSDEWLGSELADILVASMTPPGAVSGLGSAGLGVSSPSGRGQEAGSLETTVEALSRSEPLEMERAFELLQSFRSNDGRVLGRLPVRATASPLVPSACTSYVVCKRLCDVSSSVAVEGVESIPVSFQSILNSDVWWSPHPRHANEGVASRPMSRSTRGGPRGKSPDIASSSSSEDAEPKSHGYRGRMYTLVARPPGAQPSRPPKRSRGHQSASKPTARCVAVGDVSIVHAWRASEEEQLSLARKPAASSAARGEAPSIKFEMPPLAEEGESRGRVGHQQSEDDILSPTCLTPRESGEGLLEAATTRPATASKRPRCFGPLGGDGLRGAPYDVTELNRTLRVRGDVHVDGFIFGQLASAPRAADYAEWFLWREEHLEYDAAGRVVAAPPPGSVAQLRSPEQKLSLDTSGAGPVLIVSTSPSVAAGLPVDPDEADRGALVAFLGQVPIRCRGLVCCGDQLVPSGRHDGTAVALPPSVGVPALDALGVAMEDTPRRGDDDDDDKLEAGRLLAAGPADEEDEEHEILCFVRWNHAVRRELKDEMEKVVMEVHGTMTSVLVYVTALVAAGVVALDATLLVVVAADAGGARDSTNALKRHAHRLRSWLYFLGLVSLVLFAALLATFSTAVPRLRLLLAAFLALLALLTAETTARPADIHLLLTFLLLLVSLLYHALLCTSALKLRRDQTQPNALLSCSPNVARLARRLLPCCCILAIFLCIFVT